MAYLPLSTANLPNPGIDPAQGSSPEDYFNTVLYTGDNTSPRSITGVGFDPEFVWVKNRTSGSYGHYLWDVVRGTDKNLRSDGTFDEAAVSAASNGIVSTNTTDGFIVKAGSSASNNVNGTGGSYVAWNWKANGSGVSNTDGSITSSVSANTESGFSIVSWTGDGTTNGTFGHGLSSAPDFIVAKDRDSNSVNNNWHIWHTGLSSVNHNLYFTTGAQFNAATATSYGGIGDPSATTIKAFSGTVDSRTMNESGDDYIAYCFHSVEGFSKFGSYTGNGSTDGPFVYTGFRPAFVMTKRTNSTNSWVMVDTARSPENVNDNILYANLSNAEVANETIDFDLLSNGFKLRSGTAGNNNTSGSSYIYMAFAENPFKYSNAR